MSKGAVARLQRNRQKILSAAEAVFLSKGFLSTTMDQVAEGAAVSKQTVYSHFKSKEALFLEVVMSMTGSASKTLHEDNEEPLDDRPVREFLIELATEQLRVVLSPRLMQLRRMVIGEVERFPELGEALYENGPKKAIKRFARVCAHYTEIGQLQTPDPTAAATYFHWIVMGEPTSVAMLLGDAGTPNKTWIARHAEESVRIFLCAFGPQAS